MTEKNKQQKRRDPGPKSKKKVIPESFKISRTIHPLRQILNESEKISTQQSIGSKPYSDSNIADMLAINLSSGNPDIRFPGLPEVDLYSKPENLNKKAKYRRPNEVTHTTRIDSQILVKIKTYCVKNKISIQEFWTTLANHYFEHVASMQSIFGLQYMANMLANDDLKLTNTQDNTCIRFNTRDTIIHAYQHYTSRQWTRSDDKEGVKYNNVDDRLVEIAMISAIERKLNKNTSKIPIKNFSYFTKEINLLIEQAKNKELPSNLDEYYRYVITTWKKRICPLRNEKWKINKAGPLESIKFT